MLLTPAQPFFRGFSDTRLTHIRAEKRKTCKIENSMVTIITIVSNKRYFGKIALRTYAYLKMQFDTHFWSRVYYQQCNYSQIYFADFEEVRSLSHDHLATQWRVLGGRYGPRLPFR